MSKKYYRKQAYFYPFSGPDIDYFYIKPLTMQKRILTPASILAFTFLIITGCGKDKEDTPAKTKTELISQSTWKFDKAMAGGMDVSSNPAIVCYTDNTITFAANLSGTTAEGANVCSSPTPANFTWNFLNNENTLHFSFVLFPGGSPDFTIVSLTEANLVLSQQLTIAPFPPTTVEVTFEH